MYVRIYIYLQLEALCFLETWVLGVAWSPVHVSTARGWSGDAWEGKVLMSGEVPTRAEAAGPRKAGKELGLFFFFQPVLWEINVVGSQAAVRRGGMAEPEAGGERHPCPLVEVRAPILNEWEKFIEVLQSKCMIMTPGHATVFCTLRNPPSGQRGQL